MTDSATTRLRLRKQSLGSNTNTWGDPYLNTDLDLLDDSIAGIGTVSFSPSGTSTSTTLTSVNYASDQARFAMLYLTGTATADRTIVLPSVEKLYDVRNNVTVTGTMFAKTAAGSAQALPSGYSRIAVDGTNVTPLTRTDYQGNAIEAVGVGTGTAYAMPAHAVITAAQNRSMGGYVLNSLGTGTANHQAANIGYVGAAFAAITAGTGAGSVRIEAADATYKFLGDAVVGTNAIAITTDTSTGTALNMKLRFNVPAFSGATSTSSGTIGAVPAPPAGAQGRFLSGAGTFAEAASILQTQIYS